jgi:hypothetical protein
VEKSLHVFVRKREVPTPFFRERDGNVVAVYNARDNGEGAKRCQFFVLRVLMLGRAGCALPKPHCKQVSHLHIIEGALPLTEIALQCSYPCSDLFCFNVLFFLE